MAVEGNTTKPSVTFVDTNGVATDPDGEVRFRALTSTGKVVTDVTLALDGAYRTGIGAFEYLFTCPAYALCYNPAERESYFEYEFSATVDGTPELARGKEFVERYT